MRGGYKIIDFKDANLTAQPTTIKGIYDSIESNHRKALMLSRGVVNNSERPDCFAFAVVSGQNFHLYYGNPSYYIEVTPNDAVRLVNI